MSPALRRKITGAKVTDVEKRRYPSKHYVYIIQVTWDDGSNTVVFRRYSKFFDFQIGLLESFPREGGLKDPSDRIIPFLPGKILFGRSHVREVAMKRLKSIDEYCNELVQLPSHISNSEQVLDFFESKPEDLNPPTEETAKRKKKDQDINEISGPITLEQYRAVTDYTRTQQKELTIVAGQLLEVIEKHENGWWFVCDEEGERGWVPGVYLEQPDGGCENLVTKEAELGKGEKYITTSQFTGEKDEISFGAGVLVEVLQKNLEGWWYVSYQGKQGWAPASYLEKPAAAVLRQSSQNHLSPSNKRGSENRRSFPGNISHTVEIQRPETSPAIPHIPIQKKRLQLVKTNSNPSMGPKIETKGAISEPIRSNVKPPPKRSSVNRNSFALKPHQRPPLPPAPKVSSEPVYEYFTSASFSADIPHGISFEKDKKVKVIEKSPGDWWYIKIDNKEGWAPASHVEKVFHQEKSKPPQRPKPPSPTSKPSQSQTGLNASSKSTAMHRTVNDDASQRKSPTLLKPKKLAAANGKPALQNAVTSKPTNAKTTAGNVAFGNCKPSSHNGEIPKPTSVKPMAGNVAAAKNNLKNSLQNAASKNQPAKPAVKPFPKPLLVNKPKLKSPPASGNSQLQKKPVVPPPANGFKKPVAFRKPDVVAQQVSKNDNVQVDFRSVLKSASNSNRKKSLEHKNVNLYKAPSGNPGSKPFVPNKPAPKSAAGKTTSLMTGKAVAANASKEKSAQLPAAKPGAKVKPVLQRFQQNGNFPNQNWNNNSGSGEQAKPNIAIVNRVELEHSVPSDIFQLRGMPDGQVDDVIVSDIKSRNDKASDSVKYIAVADFEAENPNEMTFAGGDEAWLIEKSNRGWWYMKIKSKVGWVPCFYFEKESEAAERESAAPKIDSCKDSVKNLDVSPKANLDADDDPLYSEIYEEFVNHNDNRYRTICTYTATDPSVLSVGSGDTVCVLERNDSGWWFVRIIASEVSFVNQEGWLPCDYLEKV